MNPKNTPKTALSHTAKKQIFLSMFFVIIGVLAFSLGALATSFPTKPNPEELRGKSRITTSPQLNEILAGTADGALIVSGKQGSGIVIGLGSQDGTGADCALGEERIPLDSDALLLLQEGYLIGDQEITKVGITYICTESNSISWSAGDTKYWEDTETRMFIDTNGRMSINTEYADMQDQLEITGGSALVTPGNPIPMGSIEDDATTTLQHPFGIAISGKYAYVTSAGENGVQVLDIANPSNPTPVGKIVDNATTTLSNPYAIAISGKYAYVTSFSENGVQVIDISNPSNPTPVGSIVDDATTTLQNPFGIAISGKYAYVTSYSENGVQVIDISNPSNPTPVGKIVDDATTTLHTPHGIAISGKYAYVTSAGEDGVQVIDISDPSNPTAVGSIVDDTTTTLDRPYDIAISGKYAYVTSFSENGVQVIDISNPSNPTPAGSIVDDATTTLQNPFGIAISGKYAYVTSYIENGVQVIDISDPSNPTAVGSIVDDATTTLADVRGIAISGKYAYVTSAGENGVQVLDIGGITVPAGEIGSVEASSFFLNGDGDIEGNLTARTSLNVGSSGIKSDGPLAIQDGTSTIMGRVGIQTNDPSHPLEVNGDINLVVGGYYYDGTCVGGSCPSDQTLKTDIAPLSGSLQKITALIPSTFRFRDEQYGKGIHTGLIAQEVEQVFPEWVETSPDGHLGIVYGLHMEVHLIQAIKELSEKYEAKKSALQKENEALTKRLEALQNTLPKS
jgi:hypothetical protein